MSAMIVSSSEVNKKKTKPKFIVYLFIYLLLFLMEN